MPRTKTAKRAPKRVAKTSMNHYMTIEKEFMGIPAQFASQVKKDINAHKQKETKLKSAWNKSKKSVKTAETRLKAASKNKSTRAGKKQFKTIKKMHADAVKHQSGLMKQVNEVNKVIVQLVSKHAKLAALSKHLTSFNRDWAKQVKANAAKKDKMTTTKTRAKRKPRTENYKAATENQNFERQYETQDSDNAFDTVRTDETAESTS